MNNICPLCQQPIIKHGKNKSCECTFEQQEQYLRDLRNEALRNKTDEYSTDKNADRESKTYSLNTNFNKNRFRR